MIRKTFCFLAILSLFSMKSFSQSTPAPSDHIVKEAYWDTVIQVRVRFMKGTSCYLPPALPLLTIGKDLKPGQVVGVKGLPGLWKVSNLYPLLWRDGVKEDELKKKMEARKK